MIRDLLLLGGGSPGLGLDQGPVLGLGQGIDQGPEAEAGWLFNSH